MKYKALLLDIDNTLYDYNVVHAVAINSVMKLCINNSDFDESKITSAYEKARQQVHLELLGTASSHNRLLYFQRMCELMKLNPLQHSMEMYNTYWDSFLEHLLPFPGVFELLKKYKNKICLITDLTAHIQYRKIEKLKLEDYCQFIVTSEEAGKEKPHPYIFLLALQKLGLKASEVCMIGDSFKKDICGAAGVGIDAIWFNHENKQESYNDENIQEVRTFAEIRFLL